MDETALDVVKTLLHNGVYGTIVAVILIVGPRLYKAFRTVKQDNAADAAEAATKKIKDAADLFVQREALLQANIKDAKDGTVQAIQRLEMMQAHFDKMRDELRNEKDARMLAQTKLTWTEERLVFADKLIKKYEKMDGQNVQP